MTEQRAAGSGRGLARSIAEVVICFVLMGAAVVKVLDSAVVIVERTFLSFSFFGVLVLVVASALPELFTSLLGVLKKRGGISAGVLIGSNITNPALALGLGALVSSYSVPRVLVVYDLTVKIFTGGLLLVLFGISPTLRRPHAVVLLILYLAYLMLRQMYFPLD